ncbi:MAG: hypothetical protein RIQ81_530 [Pseudomonadota bacterium]
MIHVEKLRKVYDGRPAIEDVTFEIAQGQTVGLLGLNGAGKSTVLKILGAMLMPSSGTARVGGFSIEDSPQEVRRLIGFLPDQPPLYDEMSVRDYLKFVAGLKGITSAKAASAADAAIDRTNLADVANDPIESLSHGFRQRTGIAQAIVHQPKVVILDEPINGLDPLQIVEMRDLILALRGDHTIILSSHILSEITRTCDRIMVIDGGRVSAEGSEAELRSRMQGRHNIDVEIANPDHPAAARISGTLQGIKGVQEVSVQGHTISIQASDDCRSEIARAVVESGVGLNGLLRRDDGLESLFMKLVQKGAANE